MKGDECFVGKQCFGCS